ncbi:hypothetical protein FB45DRAFT_866568 [Roridomyces roridus]|uniref:Uncharacterized protein n=1 Tax=Roridomyces roridus TaxID=1738132 RepID=A0AAD7FR07_9AGAR|nr:hypothetical protein FB45DRAFT_866568 [Roridomyces roridus]
MLGHITFGIFAALALHLVAALPGNLVTIPMPTVLAPDATDTIPLPAAIIGVDNGKTTYRIVDTDTNDPDDTVSSLDTQPHSATIAAASNAVSLAISLFDLVGGFDCTITGTDDAAACQGTSLLVSPTEALGELVLDVTATLTGTPASAIGALAITGPGTCGAERPTRTRKYKTNTVYPVEPRVLRGFHTQIDPGVDEPNKDANPRRSQLAWAPMVGIFFNLIALAAATKRPLSLSPSHLYTYADSRSAVVAAAPAPELVTVNIPVPFFNVAVPTGIQAAVVGVDSNGHTTYALNEIATVGGSPTPVMAGTLVAGGQPEVADIAGFNCGLQNGQAVCTGVDPIRKEIQTTTLAVTQMVLDVTGKAGAPANATPANSGSSQPTGNAPAQSTGNAPAQPTESKPSSAQTLSASTFMLISPLLAVSLGSDSPTALPTQYSVPEAHPPAVWVTWSSGSARTSLGPGRGWLECVARGMRAMSLRTSHATIGKWEKLWEINNIRGDVVECSCAARQKIKHGELGGRIMSAIVNLGIFLLRTLPPFRIHIPKGGRKMASGHRRSISEDELTRKNQMCRPGGLLAVPTAPTPLATE